LCFAYGEKYFGDFSAVKKYFFADVLSRKNHKAFFFLKFYLRTISLNPTAHKTKN